MPSENSVIKMLKEWQDAIAKPCTGPTPEGVPMPMGLPDLKEEIDWTFTQGARRGYFHTLERKNGQINLIGEDSDGVAITYEGVYRLHSEPEDAPGEVVSAPEGSELGNDVRIERLDPLHPMSKTMTVTATALIPKGVIVGGGKVTASMVLNTMTKETSARMLRSLAEAMVEFVKHHQSWEIGLETHALARNELFDFVKREVGEYQYVETIDFDKSNTPDSMRYGNFAVEFQVRKDVGTLTNCITVRFEPHSIKCAEPVIEPKQTFRLDTSYNVRPPEQKVVNMSSPYTSDDVEISNQKEFTYTHTAKSSFAKGRVEGILTSPVENKVLFDKLIREMTTSTLYSLYARDKNETPLATKDSVLSDCKKIVAATDEAKRITVKGDSLLGPFEKEYKFHVGFYLSSPFFPQDVSVSLRFVPDMEDEKIAAQEYPIEYTHKTTQNNYAGGVVHAEVLCQKEHYYRVQPLVPQLADSFLDSVCQSPAIVPNMTDSQLRYSGRVVFDRAMEPLFALLNSMFSGTSVSTLNFDATNTLETLSKGEHSVQINIRTLSSAVGTKITLRYVPLKTVATDATQFPFGQIYYSFTTGEESSHLGTVTATVWAVEKYSAALIKLAPKLANAILENDWKVPTGTNLFEDKVTSCLEGIVLAELQPKPIHFFYSDFDKVNNLRAIAVGEHVTELNIRDMHAVEGSKITLHYYPPSRKMTAGLGLPEKTEAEKAPQKYYAHYLQLLDYFKLNLACEKLNASFDSFGIYLVGSVLKRKDFRDVDLRCIMKDDVFEATFKGHKVKTFDAAVSEFLRSMTGLPIDFQFQSQTEANTKYPSPQHQRNAIG